MSENTFNIDGMPTFVALPVDTTNDNTLIDVPSQLRIVKNVLIKTTSDGIIYLINSNDLGLNQETQPIIDGSLFTQNINCELANLPIQTQDTCVETPLNETHLPKSSPDKPVTNYKCPKCKEVFNKVALYRKHMSWHRNMKKFKCDKCSASYNVESNLKIHMAMHAEGKPKCPICELSFQRIASLKSHLLLHQVEELYNCEECSAEFEKEDELNKHIQNHINQAQASDNLICSYCKVKFDDQKAYKEHISHHVKVKKLVLSGKKSRKTHGHKEYSYVCEVCQKSFSKSSLLERHLRVHSGERPFICHICEKGFNQKGTLQIHLNKHKGIKPFQCTLCSARFNQKGNLRVHVEKTHTAPQPGVKTYKCAHCTCIFKKVASLNVHVTKTHATAEANVASVIDNLKDLENKNINAIETTNKENLRANNKKDEETSYVKLAESFLDGTVRRYLVKQRKVNDVRYYICTYCSKEFKKPSDLIRHTRVHTREKPFTCKQCGASFSLKSTLFCHSKTHTANNNSHICPLCQKKFASTKTLNLHLKKHNDKQDQFYRCTICNKILTSQQKAHLHQQIHLNQTNQESVKFNIIKQPLSEQSQQSSDFLLYQCQYCNVKFTKLQTYTRHVLTHVGDKKYKCDQCSKSYFSAHSLKEHSLSHSGVKNFMCKICGKRFMTSTRLKRHTQCHSISCQHCNETFSSMALLKKHLNAHHSQLANDIDTTVSNINQSDPALNMNVTTNEPINSALNENATIEDNGEVRTIFISSDDLQLVDNSLYSQLKLQNCDANFLNPLNDLTDGNVFTIDNLNTDLDAQNSEIYNSNQIFNIVNSEPINQMPSISELVNKVIKNNVPNKNKSEGTENVVANNNSSYYSNSDINLFLNLDSDFVSNDTLNLADINLSEVPPINTQENSEKNQVEKKVASEEATEQFNCTKCRKSFTNMNSFTKHVNSHNASNKVVVLHNCNYCSKEFKKQSDLIRHLRTHTGERPFSCDKCDRKFSLKSTLQSHQRTHNPVSPKTYNCVVCNSFFTSKSSLKVHMHLHTGAKPHQCNFCEMKFRTAAHRKAHEASCHLNSMHKKSKNKIKNVLESVAMEVLNDQPIVNNTNTTENQLLENVLVVQDHQIPGDQLNLLSEPNAAALTDSLILQQQLPPSSFLFQDQSIPTSLIQLDDGILLNIKTIPNEQAPEQQELIFHNISQASQPSVAMEKPRNLECDICHKRYASKDVLRKHKKIHGRYRKFPCSKCDKGFDVEADLEKHEKTHDGFKPYSCAFCSNSFAKKQSLTTHIKRIHSNSKKSVDAPKADDFLSL